MLNQLILVGRLTKDPEIIESENGIKRSIINVAVSRSYKNSDGLYETDFFNCILWNGIAESTCEYCHKGDVVGIKGRLQSSNYEKDGETKYSIDIIAEKVTFLSSKKDSEEDNE